MKLYCLIVGIFFLVGSVILLLHRIYFIFRAKTVRAVVVDKVFRNKSTETRSSKAKVLKLEFQYPGTSSNEYICDSSVLTPFFKINDSIKLSVLGNKVLLKHELYVILAPVGLAIFGLVSIYVFYKF